MNSNDELANRLIAEGILECGEYTLASGAAATRKLNWDNISRDSDTYWDVVHEMGELVSGFDPDVIVPVPEGANELGTDVGDFLNLPVVYLGREANSRRIFVDDDTRQMLDEYDQAMLIDDIFTTGSSLLRATRAIHRGRVAGAAVIWDRSMQRIDNVGELYLPSRLRVESLIRKYVSLGDV